MKSKLFLFGIFICSCLSLAGQHKTVNNIIYVKLLPDVSVSQDSIGVPDELNKRYGAVSEPLFKKSEKYERLHRNANLHLWFAVRFKGKTNPAAVAEAYRRHPSVSYAEPVYEIIRTGFKVRAGQSSAEKPSASSDLSSDLSSDDPLLPRQWNYHNAGNHRGSLAGADIRLLDAWNVARGAAGVTAALIDGGIDASHTELVGNVNIEARGSFVGERSSSHEDFGGTPPAGIIAALGKNARGIAGVAGGAKLGEGVKLIECNISGKEVNLPAAFVHAADKGAVICQANWHYASSEVYNRALYEALMYFCEYAGKDEHGNPRRGTKMSGGLVLVPAGDANSDKKYYPQAFEETLTVGATGLAGKKTRYSNFGQYVDITAPGGEAEHGKTGGILTTFPGERYDYFMGTAAACAHLTGIAALTLGQHGNAAYTPNALRCRLVSSARQDKAADALRALTLSFPSITGVAVSDNILNLKEGDSYRLGVQIFPQNACGGKLLWTSSNSTVATVSASGTVKALKEGIADITVRSVEGGFKSSCGVKVEPSPKKSVKGLTLLQTNVHVNLNEETVLKAITIPEDASDKTIIWTSSNPTAVSIDAKGKIRGLLCGGASTIVATSRDGKFTASCVLTVGRKLTGLNISAASLSLELNEVKRLTSSPLPEDACNASPKWKSENPTVATVDAKGNVKGLACGSTTVSVSSDGVMSQCTVSVGKPVTGVGVSDRTLRLSIGEEKSLTATVIPATACNKAIKWTSASPEIATVDASGKVRGTGCGKTTIRVATQESDFAALCEVEVGKPVSGIRLSDVSVEISVNQEFQLSAEVMPETACNKAISWSSGNIAIASISKDGRIKGLKCGQTTITARSSEGNHTVTCRLTVGKQVSGISLSPTSLNLAVNQTQQLTVSILPADACDKGVSWRSDNPSVAEVSSTGRVKALSCGEATIFVTAGDGGFSARCDVKVGRELAGVTLSPSKLQLQPEAERKLTAAPFPDEACNKEISWISDNPAVATVDNSGKIRAISCGTTIITVRTRENGFEAKCEVSVGKAVVGLSLSKNSATIAKGNKETLLAEVLPDGACNSRISWITSNPAVATVNEGRVQAISTGKATITAIVGDGRFKASCEVEVVD
ncbi:MAG: Ig-like domain-containing protein [Prevotellaceae bacterium]|nr:Ig-like domain-containing protein [Prevotellaceae bacterium]